MGVEFVVSIYAVQLSHESRFTHGLNLVVHHLKKKGYDPSYVKYTDLDGSYKPKVWLCSIMWAGDYLNVLPFFKRVKQHPLSNKRNSYSSFFILGGHGLHNSRTYRRLF